MLCNPIRNKLQNKLLTLISAKKRLQFFSWDFITDTVYLAEKPFVLPDNIKERYRERMFIPWTQLIQPSDYNNLIDIIKNTPATEDVGQNENVVNLHILDGHNKWRMFKLYIVIIKRREDECRVYGFIESIDSIADLYETRQQLLSALERDALTGIYNKATFNKLVKEKIRKATETDRFALLVIDADNFKMVNDNFGHLFGDQVLQNITKKLKIFFPAPNIIGRIGGDEFTVFIPKFVSDEQIETRLDSLLNSIQTKYTDSINDLNFSLSVGVAVYPDDGRDFRHLFNNADIALYTSKREGKNRYAFYHPDLIMKQCFEEDIRQENCENEIDCKMFREHMIEYIFKLLQHDNDYDKIINQCIRLFTIITNATRVMIFLYDKKMMIFIFLICIHRLVMCILMKRFFAIIYP